MGQKLARGSNKQLLLEQYLHDQPHFTFDRKIGDGRFIKSIRCIHDDGPVVVKLFVREEPRSKRRGAAQRQEEHEIIRVVESRLLEIRASFSMIRNCPHVCAMAMFEETDKYALMVRQYFRHNLTDRIATRPFFTLLEKQWIVYQLLKALEQSHRHGITHGDIKPENVMVTSWSWVVLTDFACYKPSFVAEDSPMDFHFYFDSSGRNKCYFAPERIAAGTGGSLPTSSGRDYSSSPTGSFARMDSDFSDSEAVEVGGAGDQYSMDWGGTAVMPTMDIFSLGCVIAELFAEGTPLFDFADLMRYRQGDFTPRFDRIKFAPARRLVRSMTALDPLSRGSAQHYLHEWEKFGFDARIISLESYISTVMSMQSSDDQIGRISCDLEGFVEAMTMKNVVEFDLKETAPADSNVSSAAPRESPRKRASAARKTSRGELCELEETLADFIASLEQNMRRDQEVDDVARLFRSVSEEGQGDMLNEDGEHANVVDDETDVGDGEGSAIDSNVESNSTSEVGDDHATGDEEDSSGTEDSFAAGGVRNGVLGSQLRTSTSDEFAAEGIALVLKLVCACVRDADSASKRYGALAIFERMLPNVNDNCRMHLLLPYSVALLKDECPLVRAGAICVISQIMKSVGRVSKSEARIFPDYLLPSISALANDKEVIPRVALALRLGQFAANAARLLEQSTVSNAQTSSEPRTPTPRQLPRVATVGSLVSSSLYRSAMGRSQSKLGTAAECTLPTGSSYDEELADVRQWFCHIITHMCPENASPAVKRAVLQDLDRLAKFFGRKMSSDFLVPFIITFLNDRDWLVREQFFLHIPSVLEYCDANLTSQLRQFCVCQGIVDVQEEVVAAALHCLTLLVRRTDCTRAVVSETVSSVGLLLVHPFLGVRLGAAELLSTIVERLDTIDRYSYVLPLLRPMCTTDIDMMNFEPEQLFSWTVSPLPSQYLAIMDGVCLEYSRARQSNSQEQSLVDLVFTELEQNGASQTEINVALKLLPYAYSRSKTVRLDPPKDALQTTPVARRTADDSTPLLERNYMIQRDDADVRAGDEAPYALLEAGLFVCPELPVYCADAVSGNVAQRVRSSGSTPSAVELRRGRSLSTTLIPKSAPKPEEVTLGTALQQSIRKEMIGTGLITIEEAPTQASVAGRVKDEVCDHGSTHHQPEVGLVECPVPCEPDTRSGRLTSDVGTLWRMDDQSERPVSGRSLAGWRPQGKLAMHSRAHNGALTQLALSDDHLFFVSSSTDGTAAVWDSRKLDTDGGSVPALRYDGHIGSSVRCCTVMENSHTVVTGASDGSVHLWRVESAITCDDHATTSGSLSSYPGAFARYQSGGGGKEGVAVAVAHTPLQRIQAVGEAVVSVGHFSRSHSVASSVVLVACENGSLRGWDTRCKREAMVCQHARTRSGTRWGSTVCMAMDKDKYWAVAGSTRGAYTCWDLRFQVPLARWYEPACEPINCLTHCDASCSASGSRGPLVAAGVNYTNEVHIWDIQNGHCTDVIKFHPPHRPAKPHSPRAIASTSHAGGTSPLAKSRRLPSMASITSDIDFFRSLRRGVLIDAANENPFGVCSLAMNQLLTREEQETVDAVHAVASPWHSRCFIVGGTDRSLRFVDVIQTEQSYTVSDEYVHNPHSITREYSRDVLSGVRVHEEHAVLAPEPRTWPAVRCKWGKELHVPPRDHHNDTITCIDALELPQRFLLSGSADGVIKAWS